MKKIGFVALWWFFSACSPKHTVIIPETDAFRVMPASFPQHVLIEYAQNENNADCPEAALSLQDFQAEFGSRLTMAAFHVTDWLEIPFSSNLAGQLGGMPSIPRAGFNRITGTNTLNQLDDNVVWLSQANWYTHVLKAFKTTAPLSIALQTTLNSDSTADATIYIAHKDLPTSPMRLMLYLVEDNLPSLQQQGADSSFVHQHVIRDVVTDYAGDAIQLSQPTDTIGKIDQLSYANIPLTGINLFNCRLIAFVYRYDNDFRKRQIINVQEVKLGYNKYWD